MASILSKLILNKHVDAFYKIAVCFVITVIGSVFLFVCFFFGGGEKTVGYSLKSARNVWVFVPYPGYM